MENKKSSKGLVICLTIFMLVFAACAVLLFTGVIKSPLIKEKDCTETKCSVDTKTDKKNDSKTDTTVKEDRYYQYCTESSEMDSNGNPVKRCTEIELTKDGKAKIEYLGVNDALPKEGIYVENDSYIALFLNSKKCVEGNNQVSDSCKDSMILIKSNDGVVREEAVLYHFSDDNQVPSIDFKKVEKTELQTNLKN